MMAVARKSRLTGLGLLAAATACLAWAGRLWPWIEGGLALPALLLLLGVPCLALAALLLRAPRPVQFAALSLLSLIPAALCLGLTLAVSAFWLTLNDGCHHWEMRPSGLSIPCEFIYIPLILLTSGIGLGLAFGLFGGAFAWGMALCGLGGETDGASGRAKRLFPGGVRAWLIGVVLLAAVVAAVAIPYYEEYKKRGMPALQAEQAARAAAFRKR